MPKGGARANPGPAPAAHSQAKDRAAARVAKGLPAKTSRAMVVDDGEWLTLPREGRSGNPPAWPLSQASRREYELWRRLWRMPQALVWERVGSEISVAVHVRTLVRAEQPDSKTGLTNTLRLQMDGLGLSPIGLRSLKWRISQTHTAQAAAGPVTSDAPNPTPVLSPKERMMRLVSGGNGG